MRKGFTYLIPLSIGVAVIVATPIIFIIYSVATVDPQLWIRLYETRLRVILPNTIKLLLSVGLLTILLGVTTAWIVTRYNFRGKSLWQWALILPLAVPGYVLAYAYASIMAPGGWFQTTWINLFGDLIKPPYLYSFWGVSIMLSLVNYPYVYMLARASFLSQNAVYDDAARVLGGSKWKRFWSINFPLAYPGIVAGVALALMEVMADFGTVALLRYPTFTEAIYRQMTARFDPLGASALSIVLVGMTFIILSIERYFRGKRRFEQTNIRFQTYVPKNASFKKELLFTLVLLALVGIAFIAPLSHLIKWSIEAVLKGGFDSRFIKFTFNSLLVSSIASLLAIILAIPVAYLNSKRRGSVYRSIFYLSTLGYSLPGPVIAVGVLLTANLLLPNLYGGLTLLITAYIIRFIPITLQSQESSLSAVSKSLEDASRTLGAGTWKTITRVILPLIKPAMLTGGVIVFVDCMKELPATLMLRPIAFDTLSVRVWMEASEALWEMAALPALFIVIVGLIPVILMINRMQRGMKNGLEIT